MAAVKGYVEKIKYRNEDNGYSVLSVTGADDGEEYILVGNFSYITGSSLRWRAMSLKSRKTLSPWNDI